MNNNILLSFLIFLLQEVLQFVVKESPINIVAEAYDGAEAVEKALLHRPDVILMDLVMPKMSGIEATKEILRKMPNIRIIACSTESHESMVMQAIAAGCCDFVSKPFRAEQLVDVITKSLKIPDIKSENKTEADL